jgi:hypothetical protein
MSNGSRHALYLVEESTYGTTPTSPTMAAVRHKSTSLALKKDSVQSEEIRSDRMISDYRHGNYKVGGDIAVELSYGSFDKILEGLLAGTWSLQSPSSGTDRLKAGTTRKSYSLLRHFGDLSSGSPYHLFKGCEFSKGSLMVKPNAMVELGLTVIGQDMSISASAPSGSTLQSPSTTSPFDSFTGTISENGSQIAVVTELALEIDNGHAERFIVGDQQGLRPSIGRSNVKGTLTAYFEDTTLLSKFINETESSLQFNLVDLSGNRYTFTVPRIKYTGGQPDVKNEGPITLAMPFQALYDSTSTTCLYIDRNDA